MAHVAPWIRPPTFYTTMHLQALHLVRISMLNSYTIIINYLRVNATPVYYFYR